MLTKRLPRFILAAAVVLTAALLVGGANGARPNGKRDIASPSSPANLRVSAATTWSVKLAWDASSDNVGVVGYLVYVDWDPALDRRSRHGRIADAKRARVSGESYTLVGLECGATADVWVVAYDRAGNRSAPAAMTASTAACPDVDPPSVPEGFRQQATTQDAVLLTWDASIDNVGVVAYGVYRDGVPVASTASSQATLSGLVCDSLYVVAVDAVDASGNRSDAATAWVQTSACGDGDAPTTPTRLTITARTQSSVTIGWAPSSDDVGVAGYHVWTSTDAFTVEGTSATVAGLACGTTYTVLVDAFDAAGNRSTAVAMNATTSDCPAPPPQPDPSDTTPPSAPSGLAVDSATTTSVAVSWQAATDNVGVTGYGISVNGMRVQSTSSLSAAISVLACGTAYAIAVDAFDAAGNRSLAATITAPTLACPLPSPPPADTTAPTQPTNLAITNRTATSVTLGWTASTDAVGVIGYRVQTSAGSTQSVVGTSATVAGLTCGTSYTVLVDAFDAAGNHSTGATAIATTADCPPMPPPTADTTPPTTPVGLGVTSATTTSITLGWQASTDDVAVAGYGIYRNGVNVQSVESPAATLGGLTCGTAYTVSVDAYDASGNRSPKASLTVTTMACPDAQAPTVPTNVTATSRTSTAIALSWSSASDNVGVVGYGYYRGTTLVGTTTGTNAIFSGLACNTNYTLSIDAYDAAGNRSAKATLGVATTACPDTTPPSAPSSLSASGATATGITLSWAASSDNVGVTGYGVYQGNTLVTTTTSTTSTLASLSCGTTYTLAVDAVDAAGNRSSKASINASTAACPSVPSTPGEPGPVAGQGYHQVFRDDFDTLNRSVWDDRIWYDDPPNPAWDGFQSVENGVLHLRSSRKYTGPWSDNGGAWPLNTITTQSSGKTFTQGYFEARMKWTKGAGAWPGFWLLSYRHATNGSWPSVSPFCSQNGLPTALCWASELDIFEGQGTEPNVFYGTIHRNSCDCYGVGNEQNGNNYHQVGVDLTSGFHTYGMLWTPTEIRWYLDGTFLHSAPTYDSTNQPMFLLLQMWIGGWTSDPTSSTPDVLETEVDYVQVWQK